jgi:glycosyltransferase involved in cell wall biosynthesis
MDSTLVSIVVPVYNEEECLQELVRQINENLASTDFSHEIIFVDDASRDRTPDIIASLSLQDHRIKGIRLSKNSGHQAALACGLSAAQGDVVITMDGDLQHPPSLVPQMLRLWQDERFDIVNTLRNRTVGSGLIDRLGSSLFYKIFNRIADIQLVPGAADFRLLDRRAVDALNSMQEYFKFFRGQVPYIGFKQTTLHFDCPPRFAGSRSYTLRQSLQLASNGLMSFSTFGLKVPLIIGIFILFLVLLYGGFSAALIMTGRTHLIEGWLSLVVLMCLNLGLQLTFLGMIGLYIGKIFIEVKGRPLYFVDQTFGFENASTKRERAVTPWRQLRSTSDVRVSN